MPAETPRTAGDEEKSRLVGEPGEPALLVRHLPGMGPGVIYVHGATFPSALSIAYRFEGLSWMDDLRARGFDVWCFDFAGYGGSDRPACFDRPAERGLPFGRAPEASRQLGRVVEHVLRHSGRSRVSLIAHSWGTIVAGLYAEQWPDTVDGLVLFGPITQRVGVGASPSPIGAWRLVSVHDQRARFVEDVPLGHPPVLIEFDLKDWGPAYLASDPDAMARRPEPAVKIPAGPMADIRASWSGALAYAPTAVRSPTLIVRGAWDSLCTDADARWLREHLGAPECRDVKIPQATHLMHLEHARTGLFEATAEFLLR